jgi:outer membrane murein-binding lipoprotein Lpp
MFADRQDRRLVLAALVCAGLALAGCTSQIADLPLVGTPTDAPARPKEVGAYLPVNDLPPKRDEAAMDVATRTQIRNELAAARERQAAAAAASKDAK